MAFLAHPIPKITTSYPFVLLLQCKKTLADMFPDLARSNTELTHALRTFLNDRDLSKHLVLTF